MDAGAMRVAARLREVGASGEVIEFADPMPTAADAAVQLGCAVGAIANSLVFAIDGEPVLVIASGAQQVDIGRLAALFEVGKRKVKRARPELVTEVTGQPVGGIAPVGHDTSIRTMIDVQLKEYNVVWAGAGSKHAMFSTTFDELVAMTGGLPVKVRS